jgi:outer membrane protein assembly factor BamB
MNKLLLITLAAVALVFSGCSSKQYFEPEQTYSASSAVSSYSSSIVDLSRDGATLKNGQYIGKQGVSSINVGEGYRFLSESSAYVLAGNAEGILKIIDKNTGEPVRAVSLHVPIVSAAIQQGVIAYVLNNNSFGIYQIEGNRKVVENRSETTYAIDTRAASPMFIDSLAVMPMLDGKLIILNSDAPDNAKVVYLSSDKVFNNVVHLSRAGNTMVAATPKKLITLGSNGQNEYRANISDVAMANETVYLFTKEGEVVRLDTELQSLSTKKFKYAHFSASTAFGERVFALDQQGSLIVLSKDLSKHKIYDLGEVDTPVFIAGTKLYKDGKIIELSKLGYE